MMMESVQNRNNVPNYVGFCRECLFFPNSVTKIDIDSLKLKLNNGDLKCIFNYFSDFVCKNCKIDFKKWFPKWPLALV